jgi:ligand-binding sensor domain-containing protein
MRKGWLAAAFLMGGLAVGRGALFGAEEASPFPRAAKPGTQWPGLRVYSTTNEVTALAVDSRYVWVGSSGGLAVVDKATGTWHKMTSADGLPGNHVTSILRTGKDVWVTTETGLVHWRIGARGAPQRWDGVLAQYRGLIHAGPVLTDGRTIFVGEGSHWSGIHGGMVLSGGRWEDLISNRTEEIPHAEIWLLAVTKADCWFGLGAGYEGTTVARRDLAAGEWTVYGTADGLPQPPVTAAAPTEAGVWILTEEAGLAFFDGSEWTRHQPEVLRGRIATSLAARGDTVWVGTKEGLVRGAGRPRAWAAVPGSPRDVTAVVTDGDDLWCGTAHHGLWRRSAAGTWRHFREANGPLDNEMFAIAFSGSRAFVGGPSGISVLDLRTGQWRSWTMKQGLLGGPVRDLTIDGKVLWYVTVQDRGPSELPRYTLAAMDLPSGRPTGVQVSDVEAISVAKPGLLVAARNSQWGLYDIARKQWRAIGPGDFPMGPGDPTVLTRPTAASWPRVWFGANTPQGHMAGSTLMESNAETGKAHRVAAISAGWGISGIIRDGNTLWVTTFGGDSGLTKVSLKTGKATPIFEADANWVTSSAWIAPSLWLGTSTFEGERSGLVRYRPATRKSTHFWTEDGLPSVDITALAAHGEDLWVLTPAGVAVLPLAGKGR